MNIGEGQATQSRGMPKGTSWIVCAVHVFTLVALSLLHPLYDLLGREDHATVFIAHQTGKAELILLVVMLSLLLPAIILACVYILTRLSQTLGTLVYAAFLVVAFAFLASLLLQHYAANTWPYTLFLSAGIALIFTWLYFRLESVRFFLTLMSPAILIVPALFVTNPAIKALIQSSDVVQDQSQTYSSKLPDIVMVIFDEFPLISLLDENRQVDAARYPNFASLAATSNWYRETTTIHYATRYSIPSILTGTDHWEHFESKDVERPKTMLSRESFPDNLFSLLSETHKSYALLATTKVSESHLEVKQYLPPLTTRMTALLADLAIVYAHQVSPPALSHWLPSIEGQWQDFSHGQAVETPAVDWPYQGGAPRAIKQIIDSIQPRDEPALYVAHVLLPHRPFRYNEQGQIHENKAEILDDGVKFPRGANIWPSERMANLSYQAHLLQVSFADKLLGHVIDRLKTLNLYDDALVIVVADHGISFYWDAHELPQRVLYAIQASEVLYVPLFIKLPGQTEPLISDEPVQTIDVLPTVAEILGVPVPWRVDGVSVLPDGSQNEGRYAWLLSGRKVFESQVEPDDLALKRKLELFGSGDFESLYGYGPQKSIIGTRTSEWAIVNGKATFTIKNPEKYKDLNPESSSLPAYIEGAIAGKFPRETGIVLSLAVAVNGIIQASTLTWREEGEDGSELFLARVPPQSFVAGENKIEIYGVEEDESGRAISLVRYAEVSRE